MTNSAALALSAKILAAQTPLAEEIWIPLKRATFDEDGVAVRWADIQALARWCAEKAAETKRMAA